MRSSSSSSHGFTLIELLVVIGIIGALAAVLLTQIGAAGAASTEFQCSRNLGNIGGFLVKYKGDHEGRYPGGGGRKFLWNIWNGLEKSDKERKAFFCPEVASLVFGDEDDEIGWTGPSQEFWKSADDIPADMMSYAARAKKYRRGLNKASEALVADANQNGEANHKSGNTMVLYGDLSTKKLLRTDMEKKDWWSHDDPDFVLIVGEDSPHKDLRKLTIE